MLHNLKKGVHGITTSSKNDPVPVNNEFNDLQQRLANIEKALKISIKAIGESEKQWRSLASEQKKFADNFVNLYPDDDDVRKIARSAAEATTAVNNKMMTKSDASNPYNLINKQVQAYLAEIAAVQKEYPKLEDARVDYSMYWSKLETLESAKKRDDDAIKRNAQKKADSQAVYESTLGGVVSRQKACYGKRATVFKAAFVAYWLAQENHLSAFGSSYKEVEEYAKQHEDEMLAVDIAKMEIKE